MRPNQRHYVLTLGPTLVFGKHFYSSENLLQTCVGMVQTFLADSALTNTTHPELLYYIPSFLTYWLEVYDRELAAYPETAIDIGEPFRITTGCCFVPMLHRAGSAAPDFTTKQGREVILAVGAVAVFFDTIDPRSYPDPDEAPGNVSKMVVDNDQNEGEEEGEEEAAEDDEGGQKNAGEKAPDVEEDRGRSEEEEGRLAKAKEALMRILFRIAHSGWYRQHDHGDIPQRWYLPYFAIMHFGASMAILRRRLHARMPQHTKTRTIELVETNLIQDFSAFAPPVAVEEFKAMLAEDREGQDILESGAFTLTFQEREDSFEDAYERGVNPFEDPEFERWISETPDKQQDIMPVKGTPGVYGQMRPPISLMKKVVRTCEHRVRQKRVHEEDAGQEAETSQRPSKRARV